MPMVCACCPKTCAQLGATCGNWSDGCGGSVSCGPCSAPDVCDWVSRTCGPCNPHTCASLNRFCGQTSNGCGGLLNCGSCPSTRVCLAGACVLPAKAACDQVKVACDWDLDACGNPVQHVRV